MKTAIIIAGLVCAGLLADYVPHRRKAFQVAPPSGPDVTESFDATGYDTTWTEPVGSPNEDYTTSPAPLEGTQSLYLQTQGAQQQVRKSFTASDTVYVYFLINFTAMPAGTRRQFQFTDSGGSTLGEAFMVSGPPYEFKVYHGTANANSGSTISGSTTYHVWFEYTKGTGSDGITTFAWSTDGTKPSSGGTRVHITTGTSTAQCARFEFGTWSSSNSGDYVVDKFRLSRTTAFGSNPP